MNNRLKNYAIILASGSGTRFGGDTPKQFYKLDTKTILEHTTDCFETSEYIDEIIIVTNTENIEKVKELLGNKYKKVHKIISGGTTRKESSYNGVYSINDTEANILIHDGARPFVSGKIIEECIIALNNGTKALTTAIPSSDTIIEVQDNRIISVPKRETLKRVQTPQGFKLSIIKKAHELSKDDNSFTDDCGMVLKHNLTPIYIVNGDINNIKITYPEDINIAGEFLNNPKQ